MTTPAVLVGNNALSPSSMTSASTTYFIGIGNTLMESSNTTESRAETTERVSSTLSKLTCLVQSNVRLTNSTCRSRKNTANGGQSVSVLASTTGIFQDASGTDSLAATDRFCISHTTGTGTAACTIASFGLQYDAASAPSTHFRAEQNGTAPTTGSANTTYHTNLLGAWAVIFQTSGDTDVKFPCRAAGSFKNFYIHCSANTRTTDSTAGIRKTGSAGNNVVTVTNLVTGLFEDTTPHSDTVTNSDFVSVYITTGADAAHSASFLHAGALFVSSGTSTDHGTEVSNSKARGSTTDMFTHFSGDYASILTTTEAICQDVIPFACRLSNFRVHGSTVNSSNTFRLRINGVNANQSVVVIASGISEDTTNHDDIVANDKVSVMQSSAAATTSNWSGTGTKMDVIPGVNPGVSSPLLQIIT